MINKKISTISGIAILIIISSIIGGSILIENKKNKEAIVSTINNKKVKDNVVCGKSIEEFGDASMTEESVLYTTECIISDSRNLYGEDSIKRVYLRGVNNEFNKKIFETKEKILSADVIEKGDDVVRVKTSNDYGENEKTYFFNKKGEKILNFSDDNLSQRNYVVEKISPDGKFTARMNLPKDDMNHIPAIIEVVNNLSGNFKKYDLTGEVDRFNGVIIDSWSQDSRHLYVAGGIYEFYAPAKLWRIDIEDEKIEKYNLDGFNFPVHIYPDQNVAFVEKNVNCNGNYGGNFVSAGNVNEVSKEDKKSCLFEMYSVDLQTKETILLAREEAIDAFRNMFFDGNYVYYETTYNLIGINSDAFRNESVVRRVNLENKFVESYSEDESHIYMFIPKNKAFVLEDDKKIFLVYPYENRKEYIGESPIRVALSNKTGVEYIVEISKLVN